MDAFLLLLRAHQLPQPQTEFRFAPPRRWRFDYAFVSQLVAVECEGGAFSGGRHTRGKGFLNDMEKYNAATLAGWSVFRFTPQQLASGEAMATLKEVLQ